MKTISSHPKRRYALSGLVVTLFMLGRVYPTFGDNVSPASLDFEGQEVDDRALGLILGTPGLSSLNLSRTEVTDGMLGSLARVPSLEVLELRGCRVGPAEAAALPRLPRLRVLDLSGAQGVDGHGAFAFLAKAPSLAELRLMCNYTDDRDLRDISGIPSLRILRVTSAQMSDVGLDHLAGAKSLRVLESPGDPRRISRHGVQFLQSLGELRELTVRIRGLDGKWLASASR